VLNLAREKVLYGRPRKPAEWLEENAPLLLAPDGPSMLCIPKGIDGAGQKWNHYFIGRHDLVSELAKQHDLFLTTHYDRLMQSLGTDLLMMPGANDERRARRDKVLKDAVQLHAKSIAGEAADYSEIVARIAARKSEQVLRILERHRGPSNHFNLVWEYGRLVPFLVFSEFFGTQFPVKQDGLARLLLAVRNLSSKAPPLRSKGAQRELWNLTIWSMMFFAHLFGNFDDGSAKRTIAKCGLRQLLDYAHFGSEHPERLDPNGFFAALLKANDAQKTGEEIDHSDICSIMVEFIGTSVLLPGQAFCQLVGAMFDENGLAKARANTGVDFEQFLALIGKGKGNKTSHWKTCFDELYRFAPLTPLFDRVAGPNVEIDGVPIDEGDRISAVLSIAAMDPRAFGPKPQIYAPDAKRSYLEFRPQSSSVRCFGRDWALTIQREMFLALDGKYRARPAPGKDGTGHDQLSKIMGQMPDRMLFRFCKER
jgi:cytochrome P450